MIKGLLYGTTFGGLGSRCASNGTIFRVASNGTESTLHAFTDGSGADNPHGGLVVVGTKLYGTTQNGGFHSAGTVFSIAP